MINHELVTNKFTEYQGGDSLYIYIYVGALSSIAGGIMFIFDIRFFFNKANYRVMLRRGASMLDKICLN